MSDTQLSRTVAEVAAEAGRIDGVAPLSGHVLEALLSGGELPLIVGYDPTGPDAAAPDVASVIALPAGDPAELFVVPSCRGRGLGTVAAGTALDEAGAVWAHGDLPAARTIADRLGLVRARELLQLGRPVPGPGERFPDAVVPAGVEIRTFRPGIDDDAFLAVNRAAFAWHPEQGRLDRAGLAMEVAQDWFDPAGFFLATDSAGTVLAFHWTKIHPAGIGEIYVLGVDPAAPVRGLGSALTRVGLEHLVRQGVETLILYVEGDNTRARALYERFGFGITRTDVVYRRAT